MELLFLSITASVANDVVQNRAGKLFARDNGSLARFQFLSFLLCLALFGVPACFGTFSLFTPLLGLAFGLFTFLSNYGKVKALSCGPMHITVLIVTSSTLIPTLSGLFFGEAFSPWKLLAALALIVFLYLASFAGRGGKVNKKWLAFALLTFVGSGALGVLQKVHQSSAYKDELFLFLTTAFAVSDVSALAPMKKTAPLARLTVRASFLSLVSGVCVFTANVVNLRLAGSLPSQLFFPLVSGTSMVLSTLASVLLFKERLTVRQTVGLVGGLASLIALCLLP